MKSRELSAIEIKILFCGFIGSKKPKTDGKEKECFKHWNRKFCAVRSFNVWQQKKGKFLVSTVNREREI